MIARLRSFMAALFGRDRFETAMNDELRFHLEAYAADLERAGAAGRGDRSGAGD